MVGIFLILFVIRSLIWANKYMKEVKNIEQETNGFMFFSVALLFVLSLGVTLQLIALILMTK